MSINWGQSQRCAGRAGKGSELAHGHSSIPHGQRAAPGPETSGKEFGMVPAAPTGEKCSPMPVPENLSSASSIFGERNGRAELDSWEMQPCVVLRDLGSDRIDTGDPKHLWDYSNAPSLGWEHTTGGREHSAGLSSSRIHTSQENLMAPAPRSSSWL